jgi:hypothetical protein
VGRDERLVRGDHRNAAIERAPDEAERRLDAAKRPTTTSTGAAKKSSAESVMVPASGASGRGREALRTSDVTTNGASPRAESGAAASRDRRANADPILPKPSSPTRQAAGVHAGSPVVSAAPAAGSRTVVLTTYGSAAAWWRYTRIDTTFRLLCDESFGPLLRERPRFHLSRLSGRN